MKCQHCGVNFEDGAKECPICGARAGSSGRLTEQDKPRRSAQARERTSAPKSVPKTERKPEPTLLNGKPRPKNAGKNRGCLIAVFVAIALLGNGIGMIGSALSSAGDHFEQLFDTVRDSAFYQSVADVMPSAPEPEPALPEPAPEQPENGAYFIDEDGTPYAMLCNLWGEQGATVDLPDGGTLWLYADADENYELRVDDRFYETGAGWAIYEDPTEYQMFPREFTPDVYACFTICLTYDALEWRGAAEDIAAHEEEGDLWLGVAVSHDGSERYLVDLFDEAPFLFGGAPYLPLYPQ